jgi:hypothetical protein
VYKNTWWGLSIAPHFMSIEIWGPHLAAVAKNAVSPSASLKAVQVRDLPKRSRFEAWPLFNGFGLLLVVIKHTF